MPRPRGVLAIFGLLLCHPALVISLHAQGSGSVAAKSQQAEIYVTGALFGYFRSPNLQDEAQLRPKLGFQCPPGDDSIDARIFFETTKPMSLRGGNESPNALLLGTGDNFGPNYGARVFANVKSRSGGHVEKELYNWSWDQGVWQYYADTDQKTRNLIQSGKNTVPTDNVGCFLAKAGYSAIVPGKEDFRYGPERLRELARFLASIQQPGFQSVQMLGSNIVVQTTWTSDHQKLSPSQEPMLPYISSSAGGLTFDKTILDGGFVYPWIQSLRVKYDPGDAELKKNFDLIFCKADNADPDKFLTKNGGCASSAGTIRVSPNNANIVSDMNGKLARSPANDSTPASNSSKCCELHLQDSTLIPGNSYAICANPKIAQQKDQRPSCLQFTVFEPFFEFQKGSRQSSPPDCQPFCNPKPYVLQKLSNGMEVVIFGVIDPNLAQHVGEDNLVWEIVDGDRKLTKYRTRVQFADPEKALDQAQQLFEKDYETTAGKKFSGIRVLLAQMPPTEARDFSALLPGRLRFDVVVSAADDELATPNQSTELKVSPEANDVNATGHKRQTFVLVPPTHSRSKVGKLARDGVSWEDSTRYILLRHLSVSTDFGRTSVFTLSGEPVPVKIATADRNTFDQAVKKVYLHEFGFDFKGDDTGPAFQKIVLNAIRKHVDADVALLQKRDIYMPIVREFFGECFENNNCLPSQFQELMDRILWKGDFLDTFSVTGSVLTKMLQASGEFADAESSCCELVSETGRELIMLGAIKDEQTQQYFVNGAPIDSNALYTVASSDYLAPGDTGYPDLAASPIGIQRTAFTKSDLSLISSVVCEEFRNNGFSDGVSCSSPVKLYENRNSYYDELAEMIPPDSRAGLTITRRWALWSFLHPPVGQKLSKQELSEEDVVQNRRRWDLNFDTISIAFSGTSANHNAGEISNLFGGVLDSQTAVKPSHSAVYAVSGKYSYFTKPLDFFVAPSLTYSSQITQQVSGPDSETQNTNIAAIDFGTFIHTKQTVKVPNLYVAAYGHFETQAAEPLTNLKIQNQSENFDLGRTYLLLFRAGPRWQNRKSFAEVGGEYGATLNSIKSFDISNPATGARITSCSETFSSLQTCISGAGSAIPANPLITPHRVQLKRDGVYWLAGLNFPIRPNLAYNLSEKSDIFFYTVGDNAANTRFRHQLDQSIQFTVFPNLSFQPTLTLFFYENKVVPHFLFLRQYSIKINYSFDWTNFHESATEFRYKKPASQ